MDKWNWTGLEHPCFDEYESALPPMTKDEFIANYDLVDDCDAFPESDCRHKRTGGSWADCSSGALSKNCDGPKKGAAGA